MKTYWDASAVVPLLFEEAKTKLSENVILTSEQVFAWDWMWVEVEAALVRRKAGGEIWSRWHHLRRRFTWISFRHEQLHELLSLNRQLGLRSGDAGHVYVFEKLVFEQPDMQIVTFDEEMAEAVLRLGIPLHPACIQS